MTAGDKKKSREGRSQLQAVTIKKIISPLLKRGHKKKDQLRQLGPEGTDTAALKLETDTENSR
jgi:hypothetical protein